jgi:uncharacterized membrane protein (DUF2068 family)
MSTVPPDSQTPKPQRAPTLYLIAGFKLFKGFFLIALAFSTFYVSGKHFELGDAFDNFLRWLHLDPSYRFFNNISERLDTVTSGNLRAIASGTMIYGCFLLAGGTGLALRAGWAIWLAIGEAAFFVPIEVFEIINPHWHTPSTTANPVDRAPMLPHPKAWLVVVLIVNVIIVAYLYKNRNRLLRHHH